MKAKSTCMFVLLLALLTWNSKTNAQETVLVGSGSTVPAPLYSAWGQEYTKRNPKIQLRYVPIGTEEGMKEVARGSGDFAVGEMPLTEKQQSVDGLIQIPAVLVSLATVYNLPQVQGLRLSGDVLADIYLGTVKNWNAPQIAKLNPNLSLPDLPIKVVNRPAGKGSNYIFSEFLSKTNGKFHAEIGTSLSPKWPVGVPAERSSDIAEKVKAEAGAIGYVEYEYARKGNLQQALLLNAAGKFVKASPQTMIAACESVEAPSWNKLSASLANAPGADAYPLTSFTWIYVPSKRSDASRVSPLVGLLNWIYSDGQAFAEMQGYAALPAPLAAEVRKKVASLF